jgi:hypothetical protein
LIAMLAKAINERLARKQALAEQTSEVEQAAAMAVVVRACHWSKRGCTRVMEGLHTMAGPPSRATTPGFTRMELDVRSSEGRPVRLGRSTFHRVQVGQSKRAVQISSA